MLGTLIPGPHRLPEETYSVSNDPVRAPQAPVSGGSTTAMPGPESHQRFLGRRREARRPCSRSLELLALKPPDSPPFAIHATDISDCGMGFHSHCAFAIGQRLALKLRFINAPGKLVLCCIRHCRQIAPGLYHVGIEFLETLTLAAEPVVIPQRWLEASPPRPAS